VTRGAIEDAAATQAFFHPEWAPRFTQIDHSCPGEGLVPQFVPARTVLTVDIEYSLGGVPYRVDAGHIWSRQGFYVGYVTDDGLIFSPGGAYLGEFRNEDRIGFKHSRASKRRGARSSRSNRSATSRGARAARTIPSGWDDFNPSR
jgi:hypothetical protein